MSVTAGAFLFPLLCFVAAYVQTVTGFAFGLMLMGATALTGLLPLPQAAVVVSLLTIVNAVMVLARGWRDIARRPFLRSLAGSIPMVVVGYAILTVMASASLMALRLTLGLVIILSSLQLIRRPQPLARLSPGWSFVAFGALGGLMSGLFSTAGPPLVYQFYRQPLRLVTIRETLVAIFSIGALFRLALVAGSGQWDNRIMVWALVGLPGVMAATWIARRWPPPLSPVALRRIAFLLLFLSGVSLIFPLEHVRTADGESPYSFAITLR